MKAVLILLCGTISSLNVAWAESYTLKSPDERLSVIVNHEKSLSYTVTLDEHRLIENSIAEVELPDNCCALGSSNITNVSRSQVREIIEPTIKEKSAKIPNNSNSLKLTLENGFTVTFKAFDRGVAYRITAPATDQITVKKEVVDIKFSENLDTFFPEEEGFYSHNERTYKEYKLSEISRDTLGSLPLLLKSSNYNILFTETALHNYPGLWVNGTDDRSLRGVHPQRIKEASLKQGSDRYEVISKRTNDIAYVSDGKGFNFPWRIFAIERNDAGLITNQLSYILAENEVDDDFSWVKPGQVAWDWWNANNIYSVDFKSGINTDTYKYYVDFASRYGIEYILLDEGWYELGKPLKIKEGINVKEIIEYANSKNVDVILWVIWETIREDLDLILEKYADWGASGIKVDFMQRDDQDMVVYYERVAKVAAANKLLVNFHGSYKPAGLRRKYPNVITREGVRGLEHNKWAKYITSKHNLTIPFIRMVAGPMDYTPGAMVNAQPENFNISFERPMSQTTRAQQVSMYVIYESPLQMLADSPSNYLREDDVTRFISEIPTVWDETIVLSAKIKEHILMARRSGSDWFVAAMGDEIPKKLTVNLDFLPEGDFILESFNDGANADRFASDYKLKTQLVNSTSKVEIKIAPNGGWVGRLIRK